MAPPSVIAVADEPIIHSPNLPIPGGSEVATQGATDREGMPGRPVPQKRSWLTGEGTWLRSNDEPAPTDRTWWQFGGEMVRSAVELTPAMQFNEMVQQCNEYFDRPVYFNEMADALDGSTQNIMNVFSFGATDYVGATQTDTFQGWQWDWQRGLFTFSREMLISAATGGSGTMMRTSTGTARYAWGGVWIAGLGYDSYNMGQHSSQAYEDFRQGDIRGGLWHTGLAVVSAFGLRAGLKGSALGKAGSTVDETSALAKVADETPATASNPLRAGVEFEAQQLTELGLPKNTTVWRPTMDQTQSAAFKVIVGEAKYTKGGLLKGSILDATETDLLEIKDGSSVLDSTYQLRLQTYRFHVENAERTAKNLPPLPYTIRTTRPINQTFCDWLQRWGVKVERIE